jgi:hypothetical protein
MDALRHHVDAVESDNLGGRGAALTVLPAGGFADVDTRVVGT